jgi:hypothetical protein
MTSWFPVLMFLAQITGRHGQGWHNVACDYYGDKWEDEWSKKAGNEMITWGPDAELTPKGREEALVS